MIRSMLTTFDNPFNPFTHFDEWFAFDESKGYNSCAYLARIAQVTDDLSEVDQITSINQAIDEIVKENINGMYKKIVQEV